MPYGTFIIVYFRPESIGTKSWRGKRENQSWSVSVIFCLFGPCTLLKRSNSAVRIQYNIQTNERVCRCTLAPTDRITLPGIQLPHPLAQTQIRDKPPTRICMWHINHITLTFTYIVFKRPLKHLKPILSSLAFCQQAVTHNVPNYMTKITCVIFFNLDFPHLSCNWWVSYFYL